MKVSNAVKTLYYLILIISCISILAALFLVFTGNSAHTGVPVITLLVSMALYARSSRVLKGSSFTFWVFAFLVEFPKNQRFN